MLTEFLSTQNSFVRFVGIDIALVKCWGGRLAALTGFSVRLGRASHELKTTVGEKFVSASAPVDGVAKKSYEPDQRADHILQRNEPPSPAGERIVENPTRGTPRG
jgi:hypothetical protein